MKATANKNRKNEVSTLKVDFCPICHAYASIEKDVTVIEDGVQRTYHKRCYNDGKYILAEGKIKIQNGWSVQLKNKIETFLHPSFLVMFCNRNRIRVLNPGLIPSQYSNKLIY